MERNKRGIDIAEARNSFVENLESFGDLASGTIDNYSCYIGRLFKEIPALLAGWIDEALNDKDLKSSKEAIDKIMAMYDSYIPANPTLAEGYENIHRSALKKFLVYVVGTRFADANLTFAFDEFDLAKLVARTAIFATRDVVDAVKHGSLGAKCNLNVGNKYASWDNMTSMRDTSIKGKKYRDGNGIWHDDNTRANYAIKKAINEGLGLECKFQGYESCHVWDFPGDTRYYTSIMNLVLIPRAIAGMSDHSDYVKEVLRYRVYELFGFVPGNTPVPSKPKNYDKLVWRK